MSEIYVRRTDNADMSKVNAQCIPADASKGLFIFDDVDNSGPYIEPGKDGYVCPEDLFFNFAREISAYKQKQFSAVMMADVDDISSVVDASSRIAYEYSDLHGRLLYQLEFMSGFLATALEDKSFWSSDHLFHAVGTVHRSAELAIQDIMMREAAELDDVYEMLKIRHDDPECFRESMELYLEENDIKVHFKGILESSEKYFIKTNDSQLLKRAKGRHVTNRPVVVE